MAENEKSGMLKNNGFLRKLKSIKHIEIYIAVLFGAILIAIYLSSMGGTKTDNTNTSVKTSAEYVASIEKRLGDVLSNVNGAGKVSVMVFVESGYEFIYASTTEEKTNSSGSSSTTIVTTTPIIIGGNPVIIKEVMPKISGVIIVAQGANNIGVKLELLKAVQAIIDTPTATIEIIVGNK